MSGQPTKRMFDVPSRHIHFVAERHARFTMVADVLFGNMAPEHAPPRCRYRA